MPTPPPIEATRSSETALRLDVAEGITPDKWVKRFAANHPGRYCTVNVRAWPDPKGTEQLTSDATDLMIVREGASAASGAPGLHRIALFTEGWVAWISRDHPASLFAELSTVDFDDEPVWEFGRDLGPTEIASTVAAGTGYAILPASVARARARRDLVAVPLNDLPEITVALHWVASPEHPWAQDFVGAVRGRRPNSSRVPAARPSKKSQRPNKV